MALAKSRACHTDIHSEEDTLEEVAHSSEVGVHNFVVGGRRSMAVVVDSHVADPGQERTTSRLAFAVTAARCRLVNV